MKQLETVLLRTVCPECNAPCRVHALVDVPKERYEHTCPRCRIAWTIERRAIQVRDGSRVDLLDWERRKD